MWWNKKEKEDLNSYPCGCNKDDVCRNHLQLAIVDYNNSIGGKDELKKLEHLMKKKVVKNNNVVELVRTELKNGE